MKKEILYEVKIALKGKLFDTVKIQTNNLEEVKKKYLILGYKVMGQQQK